jgi:hypothetical protein
VPQLQTVDEILDHFDNRFGLDSMDTGHPFVTTKGPWLTPHAIVTLKGDDGPNGVNFAKGALVTNVDPSGMMSIPPMNVNYYGNLALAKAAPTAPSASITQSVAELAREGFPRPGQALTEGLSSRADVFRNLGGEYLNAEFGWKPFINDVRDLMNSLSHVNKTVRQMARDSGKIVRRRVIFKPEVSSELQQLSPYVKTLNIGTNGTNIQSNPAFWNGGYIQLGIPTQEDRISSKYWFSGAFTYYLVPGNDLDDKIGRYEQYINKLFGTRITPATLWNLAPWSWLADWYVDVGGALQNATQLQHDGLVTRWGYLMRTYTHQRTTTLTGHTLRGYPDPISTSLTVVRKERVAATPFGFGANPNDFTVRQNAILAALGMTKGARALP